MVSSAGAMLEQRHRPGGKLPRQSCDESRLPRAGQAPDQASRGWPGRCWQHRGQVISKTRRKGGRARQESPGATRHQTWPAPAIKAGTDMPRLTGPLMA